MIAMKQYVDPSFAGYYNVGPDDCDCVNKGDLVTMFTDSWNRSKADKLPKISWENRSEANAPHEANFLKLDCAKLKKVFDWIPGWHIGEAVLETVNWTNARLSGKDILEEMDSEIARYVDHRTT
jgi:CDP-glucose 4,6-dehydratase